MEFFSPNISCFYTFKVWEKMKVEILTNWINESLKKKKKIFLHAFIEGIKKKKNP